MSSHKITVILTTHNGAEKLRRTLPNVLEALRRIPEAELIVVDNASTDGTAQIVRDGIRQAPACVISEPRKGKSFGLNTGIEAANGELLVFIDDDVRPDREWLVSLCDAAARFPDNDVFVGQIRPDWLAEPPEWLQHLTDTGRSFGCTPLTRREGTCNYTQAKGANLMVRRSALRADIRFDEHQSNFGSSAHTQGHGGEDTRFVYDVLNGNDDALVFVPGARVYHAVEPGEMRFAEVLRRYRRIGQARGSRLHAIGKRGEIAGFRKVVTKSIKAIYLALIFNRKEAAVHASMAARFYGEYQASWRLRKG